MKIRTLTTPVFHAGSNLHDFLTEALLPVAGQLEGAVLCVTSKIVSLAENRVVSSQQKSKVEWVKSEADVYLGEVAYGSHLAVKENLFLASAGLDESNSETGEFILLPQDPNRSALEIRRRLTQHFNLKNFGVILTDSHTGFLRYGVTGVALGSAGFHALRDHVGELDLFGRPLKMTKVNVADGLAAASVLLMGEARERTPLALIHEIPPGTLTFCSGSLQRTLYVPLQDGEFPSDLYWPFLKQGWPARLRR